ncbi:MAG: S41 family peptidase [Gemmataceae bacterium]
MTRLHSFFLATVAALLLLATGLAQEPIQMGRTPDISPDGRLIAFSYRGDIWTVEAIGGVARPVTLHVDYDVSPVFSPDGRQLAFMSNRHGSYNIYVVPVQGGRPRRLTFDSATDVVNGWSPDGKYVLFSSLRAAEFPARYDLYRVSVEGGKVERITQSEAREGTYSPDGKHVAYVRGPGTWYRKGYRGSSNDDIWLCQADGVNHRQLTDFLGQDNAPMFSGDGKSLYYVSELFGTPANIVRMDLSSKSKPEQITFHTDDGVRRARINRTGEWIVYECGFDLWLLSTRSGDTRKLAIEVHADDKTNPERIATFTQGATEFALSPDEKHIAFVVHGELFLIPITGGNATRLTNHPAYDHGIVWAPDGKSILFASDRNGYENLYRLEQDDPEHPELVKAHRFKVTQLTNTPEAEFGVSYSPDGKRLAFLRAGKLWTMNPDGGDVQVLVDDVRVFDYDWSPDGKWVVYARVDGSFASELYLIPSSGGEARNITRYATYNGGVTWSQKGHKLAYISQRRSNYSVCVQSLQKPAVAGAPASEDIDWEDLHLRVSQPTATPAESCAISPDGTKVAFRSYGSGGDDLWVVNSDGSQLTRITSGNARPPQFRWGVKLPGALFYRDGAGALYLAKVGAGGTPARIPFRARMTIHQEEEFAEMFEQSWRALSDHFYDADFHGVDWKAVRDKYRPLVQHVNMKEDLYALISMMMGELNASHLGISGHASTPHEFTADLGLLFDPKYSGPGLKVTEILKRGPADKRGLDLKPGDVIVRIDGVELDDKANLSQLLNSKSGEVVVVHVAPPDKVADPKAYRRLELQAVSRSVTQRLMYERWVEHNTQRVAELSNGKLGYIHIPSMDEAGLDRFVRALYSDNFDKEAIVLDVRYNGGGFTHDQVLNYLGAKEHTFFRQRDGGEGLVLRSYDRKWTKPLVLLINNRSYSDAEIFPHAFRTLGLGKLVGEPTGAHVIGTTSIRLIDGSSFRIPRTGVFTANGVNMEREGVIPDIRVPQHPNELVKGIDKQLDKAVEVLTQDVVAWKKSRAPAVATTTKEAKPGDASAPVTPMTTVPGSK